MYARKPHDISNWTRRADFFLYFLIPSVVWLQEINLPQFGERLEIREKGVASPSARYIFSLPLIFLFFFVVVRQSVAIISMSQLLKGSIDKVSSPIRCFFIRSCHFFWFSVPALSVDSLRSTTKCTIIHVTLSPNKMLNRDRITLHQMYTDLKATRNTHWPLCWMWNRNPFCSTWPQRDETNKKKLNQSVPCRCVHGQQERCYPWRNWRIIYSFDFMSFLVFCCQKHAKVIVSFDFIKFETIVLAVDFVRHWFSYEMNAHVRHSQSFVPSHETSPKIQRIFIALLCLGSIYFYFI